MKTSPTQRSLALLRKEGWTVAIVEHWNPWAKIRQDMFGCLDLVAIKAGEKVLGIQCTTRANLSARVAKLQSLQAAGIWAEVARLECWGWGKVGPRGERKTWEVRRVVL